MKYRSTDILLDLISGNQNSFTLDYFANKFKVTIRTIRYDLIRINKWLKSVNVNPIIINNEGFISFDKTTDADFLKAELLRINNYIYRLIPHERQVIITTILLREKSPVTIGMLSDYLSVSRDSIKSDIKEMKQMLAVNYGAKVIVEPRKGIILSVAENNARTILLELLLQYFEDSPINTVFFNKIIHEIDSGYTLAEIIKLLQTLEINSKFVFSEKGFRSIAFYLFICLNRIKTGKNISFINHVLIEGEHQRLANDIKTLIYDHLKIVLNHDELNYLRFTINDCLPLVQYRDISNSPEIYPVVAGFLYDISLDIGINLYNDYQLFEFLVSHIQAMGKRIINGEIIINPFAKQILEEYTNVYEIVQKNIKGIENFYSIIIGIDEATYITMHIVAVIERNNTDIPKMRVLIACPGSMATGQLLAAQVSKYFKYEIIDVVTLDRIIEYSTTNVDFLLSTVNLSQNKWPMLVVNPLLNASDLINIQTLAFSIIKKRSTSTSTYKTKAELFYSNDQKPKSVEFDKKRSERKPARLSEDPDQQGKNISLKDLLVPERIKIKKKVNDYIEAIRISGEMLVSSGNITNEYVDSTISLIQEHGPYCVIKKGIAVVHAAPSSQVNSAGMSLLVLKEGVVFGHAENDPVHLVFCFCATEARNYFQALTEIVQIGKEEQLFNRIIDSENGQDIYLILELIKKGDN